MQNKKRILFIVPDGVGIKNYLYSKIITFLKEDNVQIVVWSPLPKKVFTEVEDLHNISIEYNYLKLLPEPLLTRLFREAATYARLHYNAQLKNNSSILSNWQKPKGFSKRSWLQRSAQIIGKYLKKDYKRILKFEAKSKRYWSASIINKYKLELDGLSPHCCFITHQRVASLMPICIAAKQLNIKVNSAIFSWDNLPKSRLCVEADNYLVWGKWMQKEMTDYYPEIPQNTIKLVGTPQFEYYIDNSNLLTRELFAARYNLDTNKKWICFSGDDEKTSPFDPQYLYDLSEALVDREDIEIIFRRCPVDFSKRYDYVLEKFKSLITSIDPIWNKIDGNWGSYYPDYKDVSLQYNLANHCEFVVNIGSTMAFDFSVFNKPCVYINYDAQKDNEWSVDTIYKFQHFKSMANLEGVVWLNSKDDIKTIVSEILTDANTVAQDKEEWRKLVVLHPLDLSSKKISELLITNGSN